MKKSIMNKIHIPEYISNLRTYQAGKPIEEVQREYNLSKISKLASNEGPLGASPHALNAMTEEISGINRYPDMDAFELKTALSKKYNVKNENIIVSNGSEAVMASILRTFITPGDEILTSKSSFIGFYILAKAIGAKLITTDLTSNYKFSITNLVNKISNKTKVLYIANPNNPTGTYLTKNELYFLMKNVPSHTIVILDEAYFEFAEDEDDYPDSLDYKYDNLITLRTFSKAYGLAGIRIGYGIGHRDVIRNVSKIRLPFETNGIALAGASKALKDSVHLQKVLKYNLERYQETYAFLQQRGLNPIKSLTNFIAFKMVSEKATDYLIHELLIRGVIVRSLKASGMPNFIRVSLGDKDEMEHFFEAFDSIDLTSFMNISDTKKMDIIIPELKVGSAKFRLHFNKEDVLVKD